MANASHDDSSVPTLLGVSSSDNKTPAIVTVTNNKLDVNASVDTAGLATSTEQSAQTTLLQGIAGFTVSGYDYIALTYVAAGNGAGEIETVTFKTGGSGGTTIATLTLAYNASNEISSVTRT